MKCPKCQFNNEEGSKFCLECGLKLELECSQCGKSKEMVPYLGNEYIDNARAMFEEMDLQWDLDELDKTVGSI